MNRSILLGIIFSLFVFCVSSNEIIRCYIEEKSCQDYSVSRLLRECYQSMSISEECEWRPDGLVK